MPQTFPHRYSLPAIALHWLMALGMIGAIGMGWFISELPMSVQRLKLINWHKWAGISLLVLGRAAPAVARHAPAAARAAHARLAGAHGQRPCIGLLYALMFDRAAARLGLQQRRRLPGGVVRRAAAARLHRHRQGAGRHAERACTRLPPTPWLRSSSPTSGRR